MESQSQLEQLYTKFKTNASDYFNTRAHMLRDLEQKLSPPLLLRIPERWLQSEKRVLIVGQETHGWPWNEEEARRLQYFQWPFPPITTFGDFLKVDESIPALIYGYEVFEFARYQPKNYGSLFWRTYRRIRRHFDADVDGIQTSVLWTNLFRMDVDNGSVADNAKQWEKQEIRKVIRGLLLHEIWVLNPTAVVFFTGTRHDYQLALEAEFMGRRLEPTTPGDRFQTSWVRHQHLPRLTVRTHHPSYMIGRLKRPDILDHIEQLLRDGEHVPLR